MIGPAGLFVNAQVASLLASCRRMGEAAAVAAEARPALAVLTPTQAHMVNALRERLSAARHSHTAAYHPTDNGHH